MAGHRVQRRVDSDTPPFQSISLYPELYRLYRHFGTFLEEALAAKPSIHYIDDWRARPDTWGVLALRPEPEDLGVIPESICSANRTLMPRTTEILDAVPNLQAFAVSLLVPGGHIRLHTHKNHFVTAVLCLQGGEGSHISVSGKRRDFLDGEVIVFDYRQAHEIFNDGDQDRIAMLLLFENRETF